MSVYLDNAATTRVIPEAVTAAECAMTESFGNASSLHAAGAAARELLEDARHDLAKLLAVPEGSLYFTSGGTESINTALFSSAFKNKHLGKHIVTTAIEHDATLNALRELKAQGFEVTAVPPERDGSVDGQKLLSAIREDTVLMTVMGVCNETGALLPYERAAAALHEKNPKAIFHLDAVQLFCKLPMKLENVDACSFSAHKIGALKGCGALYIRPGLTLRPLLYGGGQEKGMRSGTEAIPQIAAFAAAAKARYARLSENAEHFKRLKDLLLSSLASAGVDFYLNSPEQCSAHIVNFSPKKLRSEVLVRMLSDMGVYVSGGSACSRGKKSHVLTAMKVAPDNVDSALRVSFCPENTEKDVLAFCEALSQIIRSEQNV